VFVLSKKRNKKRNRNGGKNSKISKKLYKKRLKKIKKYLRSKGLDYNNFRDGLITENGIGKKFDLMNQSFSKKTQFELYMDRRIEENNLQLSYLKEKEEKAKRNIGYFWQGNPNNEIKTFQNEKTRKKTNHADCCLCDSCRGNKAKKKIEITDPRLKMFMALKDSFNTALNEDNLLDQIKRSNIINEILNGKYTKIDKGKIEKICKNLEENTPKSRYTHDLNWYKGGQSWLRGGIF
jgi:hypothetical protein